MKRKFLSLMTFTLCMGAPSAALADGGAFTVKGTINGFEGKYIYMAWQEDNAMKLDSAKINGGHFAFSGNLGGSAMELRSFMVGDINDYNNRNRCYIYAEPKDMTMAIDVNHFTEPKVTGSLSQAQSDSLMAIQRSAHDLMTSLRQQQEDCKDSVKLSLIEAKLDSVEAQMVADEIKWVKGHPSSLIAPLRMQFLMGNMEYQEIADVCNNFTPEVKARPESREIEDELKVLKLIQPGQPAPLFHAKNWKGVEEGIADLKGKYVILDFWATWCVPCRKSFPHVKALYDKYNAKGLDVFCVSDDDGNEARWKAAIEKDGIQKFHHVLRGLVWDRSKGIDGMDKTNDISDKYAVHYLPTKYLIDKDGNMVGKFNDEELDSKLKEIFGY